MKIGTETTWMLKNLINQRGSCDRWIAVVSFFISLIDAHCNVTLKIFPLRTTAYFPVS